MSPTQNQQNQNHMNKKESADNFTIHIIDDDELFCHNMSLQLSSFGYPVKTYSSPGEFLSKGNEDIRGCIILDINMPEMDGLALQKKLNDLNVRLKIIFLSGYANVAKCTRAMKAGAIDFFEKPIRIHQLIPAVERARADCEKRIQQECSAKEALNRYKNMTKREKQVFRLIVQENKSPQIAEKLGVKLSTVLMHRKNLFSKLSVHSIAEIINFANKYNLNTKQE